MTLHSIVIQKLLSTNAHLGKRVAAHHFKVFTYGFRNRMAIIDSDKTLICMRNACDFIGSLVRQKGRFMFINTNPLFDEIVEQMTKKIGCYNPSDRILWRMGGFLTNSGSPKKFRSRHKRLCFGPAQPPDCFVVLDTERKSSVIREADRLQIPIVALVDSTMPEEFYNKISYPVPANDSVQFIYLFCNLITKTFLYEQKRFAVANAAAIAKKSHELEQIEQTRKISDLDVNVVNYESLAPVPVDVAEARKVLDKFVLLKFNGALGTTMGFNGPKLFLEVCCGLNILDLLVDQIESLNNKYGSNVPLILMNSDKTHDDTLKALEKYSKSKVDIRSFNQLKSLEHLIGDDEIQSPDHVDMFLSLMKEGILDELLSQGKEYVLLVDSNNVATVIDPKILNHLIQNEIEYCMEVSPITLSDNSHNTFSSTHQRIKLAEISKNFVKHSIEQFKFVDTRNSWVNLQSIKRLVNSNSFKIESPFSKDSNEQMLLQETSVGSPIRFFDHAIGVKVPQSHVVPLNKTSDLFLLQSDLYTYDRGTLVRNAARTNPANPSIVLGPAFGKVSDFLSRFKSIPSIIDLDSLTVRGDVWFGAGVTLKGRVSINAKPGTKIEIPSGIVLENQDINDPIDVQGRNS